MNFGTITTRPCENTPPPPDGRCSDPVFALNNPDACPVEPSLILKPSTALTCQLGSVQFHAYLINGGQEIDVTDQSVFSSSAPEIALIGATSGNATGLLAGDSTITVTYQGKTAHGSLTVLSGDTCCDTTTVGIMVLVDHTKSMSQAFGGAYPTKLAFAKAAAIDFIDELNSNKDLVGLMDFTEIEHTLLSPVVSDKSAVSALVPTIPATQQLTTFYDALSAAIDELTASSATLKVLLLISDGQDQSESYAEQNPIGLLSDFKSMGGIVLCLGVRASDKGYNLLQAFSTGGFFLNALPGSSNATLAFLSGLKGYICAGNCTPNGDVIEHKGQLDYSGFIHWNVIGGTVDLQGNGFFDFLPGNGLYVDMAGTTPNTKGKLQSKTTFTLVSGHNYRLTVSLSGNQRINAAPESVRVRVFYLNNDVGQTPIDLLNQVVSVNDYTQGFTNYPFNFAAPADVPVFISIQQQDTPVGNDLIGLLLNQVLFEDRTDLITLLDDNFDSENPVYVPPRCGASSLYGYANLYFGYNCYGEGCLDTPPSPQVQDPNPLPDIEAGFAPPKTYTSTKSACASCPDGFVNDGPAQECRTATATSEISQADADNKATNSALALATAALNCQKQYTSTQIYTAACAFGLFPVTASGTATSLISQADADAQALALAISNATAMLNCNQSNNDQPIIFNNGAQARATPYPSYKSVTGLTGHITKVTVKLKNMVRQSVRPMGLLLVSPTGQKVLLVHVTTEANDRPIASPQGDIIIDDAAVGPIPTAGSGPIPPGTYQCTVHGAPPVSFPSPAPSTPYTATLSAFNGITPNGLWTLWGIYINLWPTAFIPNLIAFGWDLTITTA